MGKATGKKAGERGYSFNINPNDAREKTKTS